MVGGIHPPNTHKPQRPSGLRKTRSGSQRADELSTNHKFEHQKQCQRQIHCRFAGYGSSLWRIIRAKSSMKSLLYPTGERREWEQLLLTQAFGSAGKARRSTVWLRGWAAGYAVVGEHKQWLLAFWHENVRVCVCTCQHNGMKCTDNNYHIDSYLLALASLGFHAKVPAHPCRALKQSALHTPSSDTLHHLDV